MKAKISLCPGQVFAGTLALADCVVRFGYDGVARDTVSGRVELSERDGQQAEKFVGLLNVEYLTEEGEASIPALALLPRPPVPADFRASSLSEAAIRLICETEAEAADKGLYPYGPKARIPVEALARPEEPDDGDLLESSIEKLRTGLESERNVPAIDVQPEADEGASDEPMMAKANVEPEPEAARGDEEPEPPVEPELAVEPEPAADAVPEGPRVNETAATYVVRRLGELLDEGAGMDVFRATGRAVNQRGTSKKELVSDIGEAITREPGLAAAAAGALIAALAEG